MVYTSYFHGGYGIHGYAEVPTFAASHGCLRTPVPDADPDLQLDQLRRLRGRVSGLAVLHVGPPGRGAARVVPGRAGRVPGGGAVPRARPGAAGGAGGVRRLGRRRSGARRCATSRGRTGWRPTTMLWWVVQGEYVGRVALRHVLTPADRRRRRPRRLRRPALAPAAAATPPRCSAPRCRSPAASASPRSSSPATAANEPSRRVIAAAGGEPLDPYNNELRFRVPTGTPYR